MTHGEAVEALERWEIEHEETSEILNEQPIITLSLLWHWEAFWELSAARSRGFGAQPLQHSQIVAYCQLQEFDKVESRDLSYVIRAMDRVWLAWAEEKSEDGGS